LKAKKGSIFFQKILKRYSGVSIQVEIINPLSKERRRNIKVFELDYRFIKIVHFARNIKFLIN